LRNAEVDLTYEVEALSVPTRAKTPREHWVDLLEKNRLVQRLKTALGLEYY
jgi:hypothetical protein